MADELISPLPSLRDMELSIPSRLLRAFKKAGVKPSMMKVLQNGKLPDAAVPRTAFEPVEAGLLR